LLNRHLTIRSSAALCFSYCWNPGDSWCLPLPPRRLCHLETIRQIAKLKAQVETKLIFHNKLMTFESLACRLRALRRKSGLSQIELAQLLGFVSEVPVSRHERSETVPNLLTALGYEVIFRVPVSELFPGLYHSVETVIEERLAILEEDLQQSTAKGRKATTTARKLEFSWERKNQTPN